MVAQRIHDKRAEIKERDVIIEIALLIIYIYTHINIKGKKIGIKFLSVVPNLQNNRHAKPLILVSGLKRSFY